MAGLIIVAPPKVEPVLLDDMKNFLRVDISDDDAMIEGMITAAREMCESFTRRSFVQKGYRQSLDAFPYFVDTVMSQMAYPPSYYSLPRYSTTLWNYSQMIKLLRSPLRDVSRITYTDSVTSTIKTLYPQLFVWQALHEYFIGDQIQDSN